MIEVLEGVRPGENQLLEDAFRLRHKVFVEERGWTALRREDGREFDQFDTPATVHQIALIDGIVAGYQRLNPTTGPHLLSEVHPHMCDREYERGPHAWEWSRYSVSRAHRKDSRYSDVASALLIGAVEWALPNGVRQFVIELHPVWITRFLELGFKVMPLGLPVEFDGDPTVAVEVRFEEQTLHIMRSTRGIHGLVLNANIRRQANVA